MSEKVPKPAGKNQVEGSDIKVFVLDQAICLGIVGGDLDVVDAIFLRKVALHSNESRAIVSDYLFNATPSTEDLLKNEVTESFFHFSMKGSSLWPGGEGTTSLNKIAELVNHRHQHSVNVGFMEEGRNIRDDWGNVKAVELLGLTGMTSRNEPLDIVFQHWPPEAVTEALDGGENGLIAHHIMSLRDDGVMTVLRDDDFVAGLDVAAHEATVKDEKLRCVSHEFPEL